MSLASLCYALARFALLRSLMLSRSVLSCSLAALCYALDALSLSVVRSLALCCSLHLALACVARFDLLRSLMLFSACCFSLRRSLCSVTLSDALSLRSVTLCDALSLSVVRSLALCCSLHLALACVARFALLRSLMLSRSVLSFARSRSLCHVALRSVTLSLASLCYAL